MDLIPNFAFPISLLLIPFGIFFLLFLIYSTFNIYHLLRFGVFGYGLYFISTVYILGTVILVSLTIFYLLTFDWTASISFSELLGGFNQDIFPSL